MTADVHSHVLLDEIVSTTCASRRHISVRDARFVRHGADLDRESMSIAGWSDPSRGHWATVGPPDPTKRAEIADERDWIEPASAHNPSRCVSACLGSGPNFESSGGGLAARISRCHSQLHVRPYALH